VIVNKASELQSGIGHDVEANSDQEDFRGMLDSTPYKVFI
jgi:hypothetical protein